MSRSGRRIDIRGTVQGVGFRPWVRNLARSAGVAGRVWNGPSGVTIEAFASAEVLDEFLSLLRARPPAAARISRLDWRSIPPEPVEGFLIGASERRGTPRASIPPDLATCPDCLKELFDPADRRHRYPFINCTQCGPRFTIARALPYDRAATTMEAFAMCADCRREYEDPADRRFHAQPNACPACGPRLALLGADGAALPGDPVREAARALRAGLIVAVKGLGGYHLACDALSPAAVAQLRRRKRREEKPFAVMGAGLGEAAALADISAPERKLLEGSERPIVLLRLRAGAALAREVSPDGGRVGLMLPYTPLHHLLLREAQRPLVMTSGNVANEPIATGEEEALRRLGGIADLFVAHDRLIHSRADDSVAAVVAGRPSLFRRSRGWVPGSVRLPRPVAGPILACGGEIKNAFCLAVGESAYLGPHSGDLGDLETFEAFRRSIARFEGLLGVRPVILAHDLHPGYFSTRYALERGGSRAVAVQHHHAHAASAMAEHGLEGPVLAVAFDGTGYGGDGTLWGGEILLARYSGFQRLATLRPVALPGGEAAIRGPWRIALALLEDAFGGDPPLGELALFKKVPRPEIELVRSMIRRGLNCPRAHGAGRYFDALAALGLDRPSASYEGQLAMAWEQAADPSERGRYSFSLERSRRPWEIDLRPMVREAALDLLERRSAAMVSSRFHNTLVAAAAAALGAAGPEHGAPPVVLTGGCFQNARLAEGLSRAVPGALLHERVPPGDGGLALGQAVVADAVIRERG